eukprot:m.17354 g.17354  ORF g.17354 m.17354 type:complete len:1140 (+) comp5999_c0_seq1:417-3836(+)
MATELPQIMQRSKGLVKVIGLTPEADNLQHPHTIVWNALTSNRTLDSVPLTYQLATVDDVFPPRKAKAKVEENPSNALTEEEFVPLGIMKAGWVTKHTTAIPSVVVIFFNLEWEAPDWEERKLECTKQVNAVRSKMAGRGTRIVAVLLQEIQLPDAHAVVEERAVRLRSDCNLLQRSSLFVLPSKDPGLKGMVIRLESAFFELSTQYYQQAAVQVQEKLNGLNQSTEKVMVVRLATKVGKFHELRQVRASALNSYQQAYTALQEVNDLSIGLQEIKTVSGHLMAKICQLKFASQHPWDTMKFLREHLAFYNSRLGKKELQFFNPLWAASQYYMFATVFGEALRNGLFAYQSEHPGFYYWQCAVHTRKLMDALESMSTSLKDVEVKEKDSIYLGQTAYEFVKPPANIDSLSQNEKDAIAQAGLLSKQNHSQSIVDLIAKAQGYFRTFNVVRVVNKEYNAQKKDDKPKFAQVSLTRMINRINLYAAKELFNLKKYREAIESVEDTIDGYRSEGWNTLLGETLWFSYRCAYCVYDSQLMLRRTMELSGGHCGRTEDHRDHAVDNFIRVCLGQPPLPLPGDSTAEEASAEWSDRAAVAPSSPTVVEMHDMAQSVACKIRFEKSTYSISENIHLLIAFKSNIPKDLPINKIQCKFNRDSYENTSTECERVGEDKTLSLAANQRTVFRITMGAAETDGHELKCVEVKAFLGDGRAVLLWNNFNFELEDAVGDLDPEAITTHPWGTLRDLAAVQMIPLPSLVSMKFEHSVPALVDETYDVRILCKSEELFEMSEVCLKVILLENGKSSDAGFFCDSEEATSKMFSLENLMPGGETEQKVSLRFKRPCCGELHVSFEYSTILSEADPEKLLRRSKEYTENIDVIRPFRLDFSVESLQHRPTNALHTKQTYLAKGKITCLAPSSIQVQSCKLDQSSGNDSETNTSGFLNATIQSNANFSLMNNVPLSEGEELSDSASFTVDCLDGQKTARVRLGRVQVEWKRGNSEDAQIYTYSSEAVILPVREPHLTVEVNTSPVGQMRQLLPVTYTILNYSKLVQDIEFTIQPSEAFMYSGSQRSSVRIFPASVNLDGDIEPTSKILCYNLFPLRGGYAVLPTITVKAKRDLTEVSVTKGTPQVYIQPSTQHESNA